MESKLNSLSIKSIFAGLSIFVALWAVFCVLGMVLKWSGHWFGYDPSIDVEIFKNGDNWAAHYPLMFLNGMFELMVRCLTVVTVVLGCWYALNILNWCGKGLLWLIEHKAKPGIASEDSGATSDAPGTVSEDLVTAIKDKEPE